MNSMKNSIKVDYINATVTDLPEGYQSVLFMIHVIDFVINFQFPVCFIDKH